MCTAATATGGASGSCGLSLWVTDFINKPYSGGGRCRVPTTTLLVVVVVVERSGDSACEFYAENYAGIHSITGNRATHNCCS